MSVKLKEINTGKIINQCNHLYEDLLGYTVENSALYTLPDEEWSNFINENEYNKDSLGVYLPRNQTAVVKEGSILNLFHEYYGHGLYCEKTKKGQELVGLEKKLLEEEREEFKYENFTLEELKEYRNSNETFQELIKFRDENLFEYELFAVWSEYFLSKKFGIREEFEEKYKPSENKTINDLIEMNNCFGDLGTFYQFDLPRCTNVKRTNTLIHDILKDGIKSVKFGVLFGSKKEFSDFDIYLISDEITPFHNDWIDVRIHTMERFKQGLEFFDVRVTDPIFSGEFILGNYKLFEKSKKLLENQRISQEAIRKNYERSRMYNDYENSNLMLCDKVNHPESYVTTYLANAHALEQGKRLFTYKNLLPCSQREYKKGGEN